MAVRKGLEGAKRNEIKAIAGKLADAESMVALKVSPVKVCLRNYFLLCFPYTIKVHLVSYHFWLQCRYQVWPRFFWISPIPGHLRVALCMVYQ